MRPLIGLSAALVLAGCSTGPGALDARPAPVPGVAAEQVVAAYAALPSLAMRVRIDHAGMRYRVTTLMTPATLRTDVWSGGQRILGLSCADGRATETTPGDETASPSRIVYDTGRVGTENVRLVEPGIGCIFGTLAVSWLAHDDMWVPGNIAEIIAASRFAGRERLDGELCEVYEQAVTVDPSFGHTHRVWIAAADHLVRRWDTSQVQSGVVIPRSRVYTILARAEFDRLSKRPIQEPLDGGLNR